MSDLLRIYDPHECDERGVPLDWERCGMCNGTGHAPYPGTATPETACDPYKPPVCRACGGHGSLKAAALDQAVFDSSSGPGIPRCEDCGHTMSDGMWEGELRKPPRREGKLFDSNSAGGGYLTFERPDEATDEQWQRAHLEAAWTYLVRGKEPPIDRCPAVYYSSCEGCKHGGPTRWRGQGGPDATMSGWQYGEQLRAAGCEVEASWRPVEVCILGWAHDLCPEKLAILCLRCYAERK